MTETLPQPKIRHFPVPPYLKGHHKRTFETIFQHPIAHNLAWRDLRSLLAGLGELVEGENGSFQLHRDGQEVTLHTPRFKDYATEGDILGIRHFLQQTLVEIPRPKAKAEAEMLVILDHREALIFRTETTGSKPVRIVPDDLLGTPRHLHAKNEATDGKRIPERKSYYQAIATVLSGAGRILLFGSGAGESSAMDQLLAELKKHHVDLAERVLDHVVVDTHHRTEGQMLAQARELFSATTA